MGKTFETDGTGCSPQDQFVKKLFCKSRPGGNNLPVYFQPLKKLFQHLLQSNNNNAN
jgi:hypothetical protein